MHTCSDKQDLDKVFLSIYDSQIMLPVLEAIALLKGLCQLQSTVLVQEGQATHICRWDKEAESSEDHRRDARL